MTRYFKKLIIMSVLATISFNAPVFCSWLNKASTAIALVSSKAKQLSLPFTSKTTVPSVWRQLTHKPEGPELKSTQSRFNGLQKKVAITVSSFYKKRQSRNNNFKHDADFHMFKKDFLWKMQQQGVILSQEECLHFCTMCIEDQDFPTVAIILSFLVQYPGVSRDQEFISHILEHFDAIHPQILWKMLEQNSSLAPLYAQHFLDNCKSRFFIKPAAHKTQKLTKLLRQFHYQEIYGEYNDSKSFFNNMTLQNYLSNIRTYRDNDYDWQFTLNGKEYSFALYLIELASKNSENTPDLFHKSFKEVFGKDLAKYMESKRL